MSTTVVNGNRSGCKDHSTLGRGELCLALCVLHAMQKDSNTAAGPQCIAVNLNLRSGWESQWKLQTVSTIYTVR